MLSDMKGIDKIFKPGDIVYFFDHMKSKVIKTKVRMVQVTEDSVNYYVTGSTNCYSELYQSPEEIYNYLENNIIDNTGGV